MSTTAATAAAGSSTTLATSTTAETAATASASASVTAVALTTTFTPPPSCTEQRLTLLSSPDYFMWLNEPIPVPGTTFADCYPSQFMSGYTSIFNASSSIAPLFSPLICPQAWHTVNTFSSNYIACCPDGFLFHPPSTTVDTNRPAYGGTCYSSFTVGRTVNVTAYDSATITATQEWVASSTADQAYGHVIEGFALAQETSSPSTTPTPSLSSSSASLSGGAIAGITIGVVAFAAVLLGLLFFFFLRRRRATSARKQADPGHEADPSATYHEAAGGDEAFRKELPGNSSPTAELESPQVHELDHAAAVPAELDGGWKGADVHTPPGTGTGKQEGVDAGKPVEGTTRRDEPPTPPPAY